MQSSVEEMEPVGRLHEVRSELVLERGAARMESGLIHLDGGGLDSLWLQVARRVIDGDEDKDEDENNMQRTQYVMKPAAGALIPSSLLATMHRRLTCHGQYTAERDEHS